MEVEDGLSAGRAVFGVAQRTTVAKLDLLVDSFVVYFLSPFNLKV